LKQYRVITSESISYLAITKNVLIVGLNYFVFASLFFLVIFYFGLLLDFLKLGAVMSVLQLQKWYNVRRRRSTVARCCLVIANKKNGYDEHKDWQDDAKHREVLIIDLKVLIGREAGT
jgi:hypothetical protein